MANWCIEKIFQTFLRCSNVSCCQKVDFSVVKKKKKHCKVVSNEQFEKRNYFKTVKPICNFNLFGNNLMFSRT